MAIEKKSLMSSKTRQASSAAKDVTANPKAGKVSPAKKVTSGKVTSAKVASAKVTSAKLATAKGMSADWVRN